MTPHYSDDRVTLFHGDCRAVLATWDDASVDSCVTDPPYELGFMGKRWDATGIAYDVSLWAQVLRVLKPGGHLLAFGGTRTYHRMTAAIEDAGFDIRDSIHWLYGSGFPKSHNLDGVWSGWGTALKPAHEPIVVARKPLSGTVADTVLTHGTGAINIDACRVGTGGHLQWSAPRNMGYHGGTDDDDSVATAAESGRWPANVVITHHPDCTDTCVTDCPCAVLDGQTGVQKDGVAVQRNAQTVSSSPVQFISRRGDSDVTFGGSGGASRFFPQSRYGEDELSFRYVAKPSRSERDAGLAHLPQVQPLAPNGAPNAVGTTRGSLSGPRSNFHPTVKPLELIRWLVRLVTPPDGVVLEPFAGSGTTLEAAIVEHCHVVGIELTADYLPIIVGRITKPIQPTLGGA